MLPPVLREDPWIHGILDAMAREMLRVQEHARQVAEGLIPTSANETTLAIWEGLTGLPISPPDTSVEIRRDLVLSRLLRGDGSGTEWERLMAAATNDTYRYTEYSSGDWAVAPMYSLRIDTALPAGITAQAMRDYTRSISPANLHIDIGGGLTWGELQAAHPTWADARDSYLDYDNMRFGVAT